MTHAIALFPPLRILAVALLLATAPAFADDRDVDKVNGSVTATAGEPWGDLSTVNGSIRIDDGAQAKSAETVNGGIRIGDKAQAGAASTVNGSIRAGSDVQLAKGAETVNGSIFFDRGGRIGRDVSTVNGAIGLVATQVEGNVDTVNGDVTVGVDSHVHGHVKVSKPTSNWMPFKMGNKIPRIVIGPRAVVDGPLVFEREVTLYVHDTARTGAISGAKAIAYQGDRAPRATAP